MADVTSTPSATTVDPKVQAVLSDAVATEQLIAAIVKGYKTSGIAGASAQLPAAIGTIEKDVADVTAAIPVVKTGFSTSEFWVNFVIAAIITALGAFSKLTPAQLTIIASALGGMAAVYTVVRGMVKTSTPTPAAK